MSTFILNEIMKAKKVTSQELADITGISKRTIDEYRGSRKKEPSYTNGLKIAQALEVNPYELIKDEA